MLVGEPNDKGVVSDKDVVVEYHDCVMENDKKEDGFAVFCILEPLLNNLKRRYPERTSAILMTDGVGCYAGAYLALALIELSTLTGVYILCHNTGEAGKGKTSLDGHFATAGQKVKRVIARGENNTCTPADVHRAQLVDGGVDSTSSTLCSTARTLQAAVKGSAFSTLALSKMAHRQYDWGPAAADGSRVLISMTLRRSSNIGTGKVILAARLSKYWVGAPQSTTNVQLVGPLPKMGHPIVLTANGKREKEKEKELARAAREQSRVDKVAAATNALEEDKPLDKQQGRQTTYYCDHPGCARYFSTQWYLKKHKDKGDHTGGIMHLRKGKPITETTGISMPDVVKKLVTEKGGFAEGFQPVQLKLVGGCELKFVQSSTVVLLTGGTVQRAGADKFLGYAVKPKRGKGTQRFTPAQLEFLKWGYSLGEIDKNQKMTAHVAAEVMQMVGTAIGETRYTTCAGVDKYMKTNADGKATFRVRYLLDVWRIKPWFSQQKAAFNKKMAKAAADASAARQASANEGSQDDILAALDDEMFEIEDAGDEQ